MNEDQLADLLTQHLDDILEGGALPEGLPPEIADLLTVAQSVSEAAPSPRPEFGLALKASLLGPTLSGNGATPPAGSAFSSQTVLFVTVGLLVGAAILAVVVSMLILGVVGSTPETATPAPLQTQSTPAQAVPSPVAPTSTTEPTVTSQAIEAESTPTVTPIVDVLPVITVTIDIVIEPPPISPGGGGGGSDGSGGSGGGGGGDDGGDHDRGHGNDPDHHDEDNPGNGGRK
jgi:hypothetical protein